MERIREALNKSKATQTSSEMGALATDKTVQHQRLQETESTPGVQLSNPISVPIDSAHLEKSRIVSYLMKNVDHVAFNLLRTKILQTMTENSWHTLAISSPNSGAGKTTVAINLAFSLARQRNVKVVLVDMDLQRPTVAKKLGIDVSKPIGQYLLGHVEILQCLVTVSDNLVLVLNDSPVSGSSELLLGQRGKELSSKINEAISPDIIIYDLPPMLSSDDAVGFLPFVDCGFVVVDDGSSKYSEVEQCDKQFSKATNLIGHVLNKCSDKANSGYGNYGY
ncbi:MAG: CpsD/CapB family tyrosine-protein kinase [Hyphomicrobiales bacterium]|nr:CpsD/CapB family tyrosine-protein kinase [Hyphomicrobiales bacterium]